MGGNKILDNLRYSTVKLVVTSSEAEKIGTGFFYNIQIDEKNYCLVLVTNKHMICNACNIEDWKSICFRLNKENENKEPLLGDVISIKIVNTQEQERLIHPDVDLCAFPIWDKIKSIVDSGVNLCYRSLRKELIPNASVMAGISSIEDVLMIGYPDAMADEKHNLPIVRRGITATDFKIDYEGRKEFLIDASIYKGSSGSPIVICNIGSFNNAEGKLCLGDRVLFLGVQYRGELTKFSQNIYVKDRRGKLINTPNVLSAYFNNLGFCVKSECLGWFKEELLRRMRRFEDNQWS